MPRVCTVCTHPERSAIDRALVEGTTYRTIADRTGLSETALKRHRKDHVPRHVAKAQDAAEVADADDLLGQVQALRRKSLELLGKAEQAGDYRTALAGVREARACVELLLEVEGQLDRRGVVNVTLTPAWVEVRTVILAALQKYPDARLSVAEALKAVEGQGGWRSRSPAT